MFTFFKRKNFSDKDNENKLSLIDNLKSYHSKTNVFNLSYDIKTCFYGIIKLSFKSLKGTNWRNLEKLKVGDIYKSKASTNKFLISELKLYELYELNTLIDGIEYWITYELKEIKNNKTQIKYTERIKFTRAIYGFKGTIAKINFNKSFDKKVKDIVNLIYKEVDILDKVGI